MKKINRKVWQILWSSIMGDMGYMSDIFENDVFFCRPYSWDDDVWNNSYHFLHKPSGLKLYWYKYPLRDGHCNMDITSGQFVDVLYDCLNSLEEDKDFKVIHDIERWWEKNDIQ